MFHREWFIKWAVCVCVCVCTAGEACGSGLCVPVCLCVSFVWNLVMKKLTSWNESWLKQEHLPITKFSWLCLSAWSAPSQSTWMMKMCISDVEILWHDGCLRWWWASFGHEDSHVAAWTGRQPWFGGLYFLFQSKSPGTPRPPTLLTVTSGSILKALVKVCIWMVHSSIIHDSLQMVAAQVLLPYADE